MPNIMPSLAVQFDFGYPPLLVPSWQFYLLIPLFFLELAASVGSTYKKGNLLSIFQRDEVEQMKKNSHIISCFSPQYELFSRNWCNAETYSMLNYVHNDNKKPIKAS